MLKHTSPIKAFAVLTWNPLILTIEIIVLGCTITFAFSNFFINLPSFLQGKDSQGSVCYINFDSQIFLKSNNIDDLFNHILVAHLFLFHMNFLLDQTRQSIANH